MSIYIYNFFPSIYGIHILAIINFYNYLVVCNYLPDQLYKQMAYKLLCGEPLALKNLCYYHNRLLNYCTAQFYVSVDK